MEIQMIYKNEDYGVEFRWQGGAYIDYGAVDAEGEFHATGCINVWDYETDTPMIPRTLAAFEARCIDWDQATRELQMDYTAVEFDGITYWGRA